MKCKLHALFFANKMSVKGEEVIIIVERQNTENTYLR